MYNSNYYFLNHINNNQKLHTNQYSSKSSFQHTPKSPNFYQPSYNKSARKPEKLSKTNSSNNDNSIQYFEILGIKIPFDDLLIICVLLFLFEEGINDSYLFMALILLLLS